jgi:RNA polymerase sigma factor for flagellar operon FliA
MLGATLPANLDPAFPETGCRALERAYRDCEARLGRPATNLEVCEELGVSLRELYVMLDLQRGIGLGCADDFGSESGDIGPGEQIKYVPDPANAESFCVCSKSGFRSAMAHALEALPKNEKLVVSLYHSEELTLQEIAEIFGISETRVAQIHTTAMLRIRGKLQSLAPA